MDPQVESAQPELELGQPSEAEGVVQEPGEQRVPQGTNLPPASEALPEAQEHPTPAPPPLPEEERIRRAVQSEIDQKVFQERMRWEQEQTAKQQQAEETERLQNMDDEELGQYVRQQQTQQAQVAQIERSAAARLYGQVLQDTLGIISDAKTRSELQARSTAGEFHSYGEFLAAAKEAELNLQLAKEKAKLEKEIRAAVTREVTSQEVERGGPQLGQGIPTTTLDLKKMSSTQLIAAGWQEAVAAKRRRGG